MKKTIQRKILICVFLLVLISGICIYRYWKRSAAAFSVAPARFFGQTLIIDAGHGGEDGGAISISGAVESKINLAIAARLDNVLGLFGVNTVMLRTQDLSLHDDSAETIREKKVSDLHNRVDTIESYSNATLISIHQNKFDSKRYQGAQVFYANADLSLAFAQQTQELLRQVLDPTNTRQAAKIPTTVYLMNHITCRAVLVECGFLSNPTEDALLQTAGYQTKIAAALAGSYIHFQQLAQSEGDRSNEV